MGLSSKQVSTKSLDWGAQNLLQTAPMDQLTKPKQQEEKEPQLKCPRCNSINTKFCYYNNYNRSQPRYFCKSCKRHWTNGGSLRNVPVGGNRRNKRLKTTNNSSSNNNNTNHNNSSSSISYENNMFNCIDEEQPKYQFPLEYEDQKEKRHEVHIDGKDTNNFLLDSTLSLPSSHTHFPFTCLTSFENITSSIGEFQASDVYDYAKVMETVEDPSSSSSSTTVAIDSSKKLPCKSSFMDCLSNWSWDDLNTLISTDIKQPWDDLQIKEQGI